MTNQHTRRGKTQTEQAVIQQSTIPELVSGSSTQAVMKQQALKTLKRVQGLFGFTTARGFTLIELLVVVLIIGILAAVALPQYQKAVEKTHLSEAVQIQNSLAHAADVYLLQNGFTDATLANFDVTLPLNSENLFETNTFRFYGGCSSDGGCTIWAERRNPGDENMKYWVLFTKKDINSSWVKTYCNINTTKAMDYVLKHSDYMYDSSSC